MSLPKSFRYVDSGFNGAWRTSLDKSKVPKVNFRALREKRVEAIKSYESESDAKNITSFKGLSLAFLNGFWKNVRHMQKFVGLELYTLKQEVDGVEKGKTVVKLESRTENENLVHLCKDNETEKIITVNDSDVELKKRKEWTIEDLSRYALTPATTLSGAPFSVDVEPQKQGNDFQGCIVICSPSTRFEKLLLALREDLKQSGRAPAEVSYFWIDVFCTNKSILQTVSSGEAAEKERIFNMYSNHMKSCFELFDARYVHFDDWRKPNVFEELTPVWQLCSMLESDVSFEVLPAKSIRSQFAQIYDSHTDDAFFESINNLDPTGLKSTLTFCPDTVVQNLISNEEGFLTKKSLLQNRFRQWAMIEVEGDLRKLPFSNQRDEMENFAIYLYKAGNFFSKHKEVLVAKSYFQRAIEIYEELQLHYDEEEHRKGRFDDTTLHDQLKVDKVNGGASKCHMYLSFLYLQERQSEQAKAELKKSEAEAIKVATQKHYFLLDISEARLGVYMLEKNLEAALVQIESMTLLLRDERKTSDKIRLSNIKLHEAEVYRLKGKHRKSLAAVESALALILPKLGKTNKHAANLYFEKGKVQFRMHDRDSCVENLKLSLNIYKKLYGTCNEKIAHIYHKLAHAFSKQGQEVHEESLKYLKKSTQVYEKCSGRNSLIVVELLTSQSFVLRVMKKFLEAEKLCFTALEVLDSEKRLRDRQRIHLTLSDLKKREDFRAKLYSQLGQIQQDNGQFFKAKKSFFKAYDITKKNFGEDYQKTKQRKERWNNSESMAKVAMNVQNSITA